MWTQADRDLYKDDGRRYPSDQTDARWALIALLLSSYDPLKVDLHEMVNACLYLEKTGCPWRYLPSDFGPWATVRTWHDRLRADGIWSEIAASAAGPPSPRRGSWTRRVPCPARRRGSAALTARRRCGASSATC